MSIANSAASRPNKFYRHAPFRATPVNRQGDIYFEWRQLLRNSFVSDCVATVVNGTSAERE